MPGLDGFEVLDGLQKLEAENNKREIDIFLPPIMFLTAHGETDVLARAFEAGINEYMRKPFIVEELIGRIKNQLKIGQLKKRLQTKHKNIKKG